jgi:LemA protein
MRAFTVLLAILAAIALWVVYAYNRLVRLRNLVEEAWSGIDVQLRRRADLIPNLVETVKGYAAHERGLFEEIAEMRARSMGAHGVAEQAEAERGLAAALGRLFAIAEAYPELKADANFRHLQEQLAGIEDEIQKARRYYNGTVRDYNTRIQSFPDNLIAGRFGFVVAEFFELDDEAARSVPKISFEGATGR